MNCSFWKKYLWWLPGERQAYKMSRSRVSALSDDMLREQQVNSVEDLTRLVPSLNKQTGDSFNIRGIGTQAPRHCCRTQRIDYARWRGVGALARQAFMQLMDVQRVEVLRGPQGTLFGKNSTAGVIHIITKNPTEEHMAEVSGTVISDDEYRAGVLFSGPVTDDLGYSFTAFGTDVGGYTENIHTGNDLSGTKDWTARGKLRWYGETVELKWASDYSDGESECCVKIMRSLEPVAGKEDFYDRAVDALLPSDARRRRYQSQCGRGALFRNEELGPLTGSQLGHWSIHSDVDFSFQKV